MMLQMMEQKILHFVNFYLVFNGDRDSYVFPGFAFTFEYLYIYCLFIDTGCQRKN